MNPYEILGVTPNTPKPEIKKSYLRLCRKYHPDAGGDPQMFIKIKSAWETIENGSVSIKAHIKLTHTSVFSFSVDK